MTTIIRPVFQMFVRDLSEHNKEKAKKLHYNRRGDGRQLIIAKEVKEGVLNDFDGRAFNNSPENFPSYKRYLNKLKKKKKMTYWKCDKTLRMANARKDKSFIEGRTYQEIENDPLILTDEQKIAHIITGKWLTHFSRSDEDR